MKIFLTVWRLSRELSGATATGRFCSFAKLAYFAVTRKLSKNKKEYIFEFAYLGSSAQYKLQYPMDLAALHEVYVDREYDWWPKQVAPQVIVDLGAHFGDTAVYYAARFPGVKIVAVEPAPQSFSRLQSQSVGLSELVTVNAAAGSSDGSVELYTMPSSLGHSLKKRGGSNGKVVVRQVTLPTLFGEVGIGRADLIKFDIEGAEYELFSSVNPANFADAYIGELHLDIGNFTLEQFMSLFKDFSIETKKLSEYRFLFRAARV